MTLINTELSEELYSALSFFAKKINKTESYIIAKALEKYLIGVSLTNSRKAKSASVDL